MAYASTFPRMRQLADRDGVNYEQVRAYYRDCLSEEVRNPAERQWHAEWSTWIFFWPEEEFPGIKPLEGPEKSVAIKPQTALEKSSQNPPTQRKGRAKVNPEHCFPQRSVATKLASRRHRKAKQIATTDKKERRRTVDQTKICGGCKLKGHVLAHCTNNIDEYGFVDGCPKCNTLSHRIDECPGFSTTNQGKNKTDLLFQYMVVGRIGKPPIRSSVDFRTLDAARFAALKEFPQTSQFALERRSRGVKQGSSKVQDPSWGRPQSVSPQVHPLEIHCNIKSVMQSAQISETQNRFTTAVGSSSNFNMGIQNGYDEPRIKHESTEMPLPQLSVPQSQHAQINDDHFVKQELQETPERLTSSARTSQVIDENSLASVPEFPGYITSQTSYTLPPMAPASPAVPELQFTRFDEGHTSYSLPQIAPPAPMFQYRFDGRRMLPKYTSASRADDLEKHWNLSSCYNCGEPGHKAGDCEHLCSLCEGSFHLPRDCHFD